VPIHVIPNPLPEKRFTIVDKKIARIKLNLPLNTKLILFGADNLDNPRKGGDLLRDMVDKLQAKESQVEFELVMFGGRTIDIGVKTHMLGNISDEGHLSLIYSAVDVYVFPSREDNSPLTVGESLLSGTPVVGFPVGNVPDIVQHKKTGYIAEYLDVKSLTDGILWAFNINDDSTVIHRSIDCRLSVKKIHDPILSARRHVALYKEIIRSAV
jgi:glycosyltransferase involved in cell wall biosynthesis